MLASIALLACTGETSAAEAYEVVRSATHEIGDAFPQSEDPVLQVVGDDGGEIASLDVAAIETLGTVRVTVFDRWLDSDLIVEGVWLHDLLAAVGAEANDSVSVHALDDFEVDVPVADFGDDQVLLATRSENGDRLPIEDGGPTRLVFLGPGADSVNGNYWVWNIDVLDIG